MTKSFKIIAASVLLALTLVVILWQLQSVRWFELGTSMDVQEVNFYGRVVDQNNQPVMGAVVEYDLGGSALGGYNGTGHRQTDVNGEFSIESRKASFLGINSITHADIEFGFPIPENTGSIWDDSKIKSKIFYGFQPSENAKKVLWSDTSPENPYVFKAWRIGEEVSSTAKNLNVGEVANMLDYDKTYTINLFNLGSERYIEGESEGQFRIIFHREADTDDITQRWEARIIPVNGGMQTTKDSYMNIAPEAGYEQEIHIVREKTTYETIYNLFNQQYYFTSNNGKFYGSLFGSLKARNQGFIINFHYKINPDGERSLVKGKEQ